MVLLTLPVVLLAALAGLFVLLRRRAEDQRFGRLLLVLGLSLGLLRAALAVAGWALVERTGGPSQVPAYALAMLAWPEAALLGSGRRVQPHDAAFLASLAVLLILSTMAVVGGAGLLARFSRRRRAG